MQQARQELGSYFTAKKYESLPICKEKAVKDGVAYLETFYFVRERGLPDARLCSFDTFRCSLLVHRFKNRERPFS